MEIYRQTKFETCTFFIVDLFFGLGLPLQQENHCTKSFGRNSRQSGVKVEILIKIACPRILLEILALHKKVFLIKKEIIKESSHFI
jgi:hypothetical protein